MPTRLHSDAPTERTGRQRHTGIVVGIWSAICALLIVYAAAGAYVGLPEIGVEPVYHGALFLGASIVVGVIVAFSSLGLVRALDSRARMTQRAHEATRLADSLALRFDSFEREFGALPERDAPGRPPTVLS